MKPSKTQKRISRSRQFLRSLAQKAHVSPLRNDQELAAQSRRIDTKRRRQNGDFQTVI
jgi:hypothetical protein